MNTAGVVLELLLLMTFLREYNLVVSTTQTLPVTNSMINRKIFHKFFPLQIKVTMTLLSQNLLPLFATKELGSLILCPRLPAMNSSAQTQSSKKEETLTIKTFRWIWSAYVGTFRNDDQHGTVTPPLMCTMMIISNQPAPISPSYHRQLLSILRCFVYPP